MYVNMYVCMCVCMYVNMYVCMYVCVYMYVRVYMHVCMYVNMYVCMYVCVYVCMYVTLPAHTDFFDHKWQSADHALYLIIWPNNLFKPGVGQLITSSDLNRMIKRCKDL